MIPSRYNTTLLDLQYHLPSFILFYTLHMIFVISTLQSCHCSCHMPWYKKQVSVLHWTIIIAHNFNCTQFHPARKGRDISGWVQRVKWCSHIGQQMPCWQTVAAGPFWPCFACPKLGDAGKTRVASKNRAVFQKLGRPQFWLQSQILLRENLYIC